LSVGCTRGAAGFFAAGVAAGVVGAGFSAVVSAAARAAHERSAGTMAKARGLMRERDGSLFNPKNVNAVGKEWRRRVRRDTAM
jgi:hypothetical protein